MRAYSLDLWQRIVDAYTRGEGSMRELAERFAVALNTVQSYVLLARTKGTPAPRAHGGGPVAKMDQAALDELRRLIDETNDQTLAQLADHLVARGHQRMSLTTIERGLAQPGITRKKIRFMRASKIGLTCSRAVAAFDGGRARPARAA